MKGVGWMAFLPLLCQSLACACERPQFGRDAVKPRQFGGWRGALSGGQIDRMGRLN